MHPVVAFEHGYMSARRPDPPTLPGNRKLTGLTIALTLSRPAKGLLV